MKLRTLAIVVTLVALPACDVIKPDLLGPRDGGDELDAPVDAVQDMPEPGLILRYTFEGAGTAVTDISGRHLDGTASDATIWIAEGRTGRAAGLRGTQFISLPAGVLTDVDDFTVASWVKINTSSDWARIYDFGNDGGDRFMYLTISGFDQVGGTGFNGVHASSFGGSTANENSMGTKTRLPTGIWKHLAVTGSGGDHRLYIDGFPAASITAGPRVPPKEMEPMGTRSWLGRSHFEAPLGSDPRLNGTLDDFRIYNRVLSPGEIADLAAPKLDYSSWRFDETVGVTAKDSSERLLVATLQNGVTWSTAGRLGGAARLPGGSGGPGSAHISVGGSPLTGCTTQLTIAVWFKPAALTTSSRLIDFGTGSSTVLFLAPNNAAGRVQLSMVASGGQLDVISDTQPLSTLDQWHHLAVTVDPTGLVTLYVNGVGKSQSSTMSVSSFTATTENWIGRSRNGEVAVNGSIDELRIACRAYTPDEIKNLSRP
jgi:Concanavalin A-like lectin/glucanases superfamily